MSKPKLFKMVRCLVWRDRKKRMNVEDFLEGAKNYTDIIYRQAALDEMNKRFKKLLDAFEFDTYEEASYNIKLVCDGIMGGMEAVMDVPPAKQDLDSAYAEGYTAAESKYRAMMERNTGKWINHRNDDGHNIADCSVCGNPIQWFDGDETPKFCCMCGADMRGVENDE